MSIGDWSESRLLDFLKVNLQQINKTLQVKKIKFSDTTTQITAPGGVSSTFTSLISGSSGLHIDGEALFADTIRTSGSLVVGGLISGSSGLHLAGNTIINDNLNVSGGIGIGIVPPVTALDIHYNPTGLSNDTGGGDVVTFGAGPGGGSTTAGYLYYLDADGQWELTDGDAVATGGTQLLAIALGTTPGTHGMLIRGFFDVHTNLEGVFNEGVPVYVSEEPGHIDVTAPSVAGDFVRIVGYCTSTANVIYFNPSSTNIVIA